jgi:hypothetical protein
MLLKRLVHQFKDESQVKNSLIDTQVYAKALNISETQYQYEFTRLFQTAIQYVLHEWFCKCYLCDWFTISKIVKTGLIDTQVYAKALNLSETQYQYEFTLLFQTAV